MPYSVASFQLGARMTVTRTRGGDLTIIAPIALPDAVVDEIRKLGPVRYIIAPNKMHYRYLPDAKKAFAEAVALAAPGLKEKHPKLPIDAVLGASPEHDSAIELEQQAIQGMPLFGDVVLYQASSRTIVVTDLFANFPTHPHWWTRGYLKLSGAYGRAAQTLLLKASVRDHQAFHASRDSVLRWDFDRVVVAHGDVIESGGKETFRAALP